MAFSIARIDGVPQNRLRVIFLGSRDGESINLPTPTHSAHGENGFKRWVTLRHEAIGDLHDPNPEYIEFAEERRKAIEDDPGWSELGDLPIEFPEDGARRRLRILGRTYGILSSLEMG